MLLVTIVVVRRSISDSQLNLIRFSIAYSLFVSDLQVRLSIMDIGSTANSTFQHITAFNNCKWLVDVKAHCKSTHVVCVGSLIRE